MVLGGTEDGLGMRVVRKGEVDLVPSVVVGFGDVRVLQKFYCNGGSCKFLLIPEFRGINLYLYNL